MKNMYKEFKTEMNIDTYSRGASHQTEYLENISQGNTVYVLLCITDHDHDITNMLISPNRENIEVPWSVLDFSGSVYQIKTG